MKVLTFPTREDWLAARRGTIGGTRLKDIYSKVGNNRKAGFYELIAEMVSLPADDENPMDRGARLEEEALAMFETTTGKKLDKSLILWARDDEEAITVSPDAPVEGEPAAVECKCLSSAKHVETFLTQKIPSEYESQIDQYFIVNDELQTVYMVFYDPRVLVRPFFYLTITREDREENVAAFLEFEKATLKDVRSAIIELSF